MKKLLILLLCLGAHSAFAVGISANITVTTPTISIPATNLPVAVPAVNTPAAAAPTPQSVSQVIAARIVTAKGVVPLTLEIAYDPTTRAQGLMNRTTLAPNDGMLFLFPTASRLSFWMKNTLVPLDMLFVDANGRIVNIATKTVPNSLTPIDSTQPVLTVIELNAGTAAHQGIVIGNTVSYMLPADLNVQ